MKVINSILFVLAFSFFFISCKDDENIFEKSDRLIREYLIKNNITAIKTSTGLYYAVITPGTGEKAAIGKIAYVRYEGKLLNDSVFYSNLDPAGGNARNFVIGASRKKIQSERLADHIGMDEGVELMRVGEKAHLFVPPQLGFIGLPPGVKQNEVVHYEIILTALQ